MVASSCGTSETPKFEHEAVGNQAFLERHNAQVYANGRSFSGNERDRVFLNDGGAVFLDVSDLSGADSPNDGRAVLAFDADDDGDVDLFVHENQRERHALYRNDVGGAGGFLKLTLEATRGNAEAIGATVVASVGGRRTAQVLSRGAGFASCQAPELVFGLGAAERADVEVRWPGGGRDVYAALPRNGRFHLVEGDPEPRPRAARTRPMPDPRAPGLRLGIGDSVSGFEVQSEGGEWSTVATDSLRRPLLVNFWATYCGPCVEELPILARLDGGGEVDVLAVSVDADSMRDAASALVKGRAPGLTLVFPGAAEAGRSTVHDLVDLARLPIPTTLVFGPGGRLEQVVQGPLPQLGATKAR